jgi:dihydrofolate synthase/folylpolyglutamate synthase
LERLFALETFGIKLGLENIRRLCNALDHPERTFLSLHIAGTNGKGSVTAMVHAALVAAGIRAARYTSPHLVHLNERFVVGNALVDVDTLRHVAGDILDCADRLQRDGMMPAPPTFFEATTAIAFEIFRRKRVEVAVIEVGLGGRFDATNVLVPPVGAITSIALDHEEHLGHTVAEIASEKAGIIKPGMVVVCGSLPPVALDVMKRAATERGATLVEAVRDSHIDYEMEEGRARLTVATEKHRYGPMLLALRGEHQVGNAAVAARVLEIAGAFGVDVPGSAVVQGFETVNWPARLEVFQLSEGRRVLLDAAHNPEGARALRSYLAAWHPERPLLVIGLMRDKDADAIVGELLPVTSTVITTAAATARAMPAKELAARVRVLDAQRPIEVSANVRAALDAAFGKSTTVCVAGSIFLAGEARECLEQRGILR